MSDQSAVPPPPPPVGGPPVPGEPGSAAIPRKSSGGRKTLYRILAVVVAVVVAIGVRFAFSAFNDDRTKDAKAGDCIGAMPTLKEGETGDASSAKVVDCTSAEARFNVLGRVENKTEAEFKADNKGEGKICTGAGYADVTSWIWVGKGSKGYVLCLKDK